MRFSPIIPFITLFISCAGSVSKDNNPVTDSMVTADTIIAEIKRPVTSLPDMVYPSAADVKYSVFCPDTTISGILSSLENMYTGTPGSFTFRKGALRDASFGGTIDSVPSRIEIDWEFSTKLDTVLTKYGRWGGGTGWTGQPLYINWPDSCMSRFEMKPAREEIIFGSLDRNVYFIDFKTGKPSRQAIPVDNPIKGTPSLDPTLNGNLYVGHGVPALGEFGAIVIDLFNNQVSDFFGKDPRARRGWNAYDSSPIRVGQFLFRAGENGVLYKFLVRPGKLKLHSSMTYTVNGRAPGMESSLAVYRNYGYTADNAGNILCINLNTLKPVWHYKLPDDTDATPVIAEESDGVFLYVGCEVEHENVTEAAFVKLDAITGREVWLNKTPAQRADVFEKHFDGGYYASPLLGTGNCSHLIFENVVNNTAGQNGKFVAYDRQTGKTVYSVDLRCYAWSSPVGFMDRDNNMYVLTADCSGRVYLFRGIDGKMLLCELIGNNFESSPVVIGNSVVIGSRGFKIYKLSLK